MDASWVRPRLKRDLHRTVGNLQPVSNLFIIQLMEQTQDHDFAHRRLYFYCRTGDHRDHFIRKGRVVRRLPCVGDLRCQWNHTGDSPSLHPCESVRRSRLRLRNRSMRRLRVSEAIQLFRRLASDRSRDRFIHILIKASCAKIVRILAGDVRKIANAIYEAPVLLDQLHPGGVVAIQAKLRLAHKPSDCSSNRLRNDSLGCSSRARQRTIPYPRANLVTMTYHTMEMCSHAVISRHEIVKKC